jgi:hypothetical protein
MKTWIPVLCSVALLAGCVTDDAEVKAPKVVVDLDQLQLQDELMYFFKDALFTGIVVKKYDNGQKKFEHTFKDGKNVGLQTDWYKIGQEDEGNDRQGRQSDSWQALGQSDFRKEMGQRRQPNQVTNQPVHPCQQTTPSPSSFLASGDLSYLSSS